MKLKKQLCAAVLTICMLLLAAAHLPAASQVQALASEADAAEDGSPESANASMLTITMSVSINDEGVCHTQTGAAFLINNQYVVTSYRNVVVTTYGAENGTEESTADALNETAGEWGEPTVKFTYTISAQGVAEQTVSLAEENAELGYAVLELEEPFDDEKTSAHALTLGDSSADAYYALCGDEYVEVSLTAKGEYFETDDSLSEGYTGGAIVNSSGEAAALIISGEDAVSYAYDEEEGKFESVSVGRNSYDALSADALKQALEESGIAYTSADAESGSLPVIGSTDTPEETQDTDATEESGGTSVETEAAGGAEAVIKTQSPAQTDEPSQVTEILRYIIPAVALLLVIVIIVAAVLYMRTRNKDEDGKAAENALRDSDRWTGQTPAKAAANVQTTAHAVSVACPSEANGTVGKVHNVGRRRNQQDTLGVTAVGSGIVAVVSDGMGGLSNGEKVSQEAVRVMLQSAVPKQNFAQENPLIESLGKANAQVLKMLGADQIYKSGATLLAVHADKGCFHWIAVGDSHIYQYCKGHLFQLNSEHTFRKDLILQAVNRNAGYARINMDPQKSGLVSFLGMGDLKYIDASVTPLALKPGDKLLLMSDGVFNTISEATIISIMDSAKNAAEAAAVMERRILDAQNPKQDNFTCVILDF